MTDENYILLFDKSAKVYPSLWWTGPSDNLNSHQNYSDDTFYISKYLILYVILWCIIYTFNPKSIRPTLSIIMPPFLLGFVCLCFWCYYYISNKIIFYNKDKQDYFTFNIPHPRRIILNENKLGLGDNIGIISIDNFKKLVREEKIKTQNYPDFTRKQGEELLASGKYNSAYGERQKAQLNAAYNIAFTLFSFAYLLSQSIEKKILKKSFYWIAMAVIFVFIPNVLAWIGFGVSDRHDLEIRLNFDQFMTYLGTSFGFLAAYIVYLDSIKKI